MPRYDLTHIIIHHTAAEEKDSEQIRRYHMSKGWQDIGYDYVIERDGKTVAGRSLSIQGAHAGVAYYNQHSIGVAVIGNLSSRDIFPEQLLSLIDLLYELRTNWNIPLENILLHREIKATECPGLRFPRQEVFDRLRAKIATESGITNPNITKDIESLLQALQEQKEQNSLLADRITRLEKVLSDIRTLINNLL